MINSNKNNFNIIDKITDKSTDNLTEEIANSTTNLTTNSKQTEVKTKPKVAIFHHFFKGDCKGGGEKLILQMREYYEADLWVGGVDLAVWGKQNILKDPDFVGKVWDERFKFFYLHQESQIPIWRHIKRQLFFRFSPKIKELANYDLVIFSFGNIAFVPQRLKKMQRKII